MLLDLCEPGVVSAQYGVVLPRRVRPKQWFFPKSFQSRRGATKKWLLFRKTLSVTPYWVVLRLKTKSKDSCFTTSKQGLLQKPQLVGEVVSRIKSCSLVQQRTVLRSRTAGESDLSPLLYFEESGGKQRPPYRILVTKRLWLGIK